jgi:lysophospholipase L1-like esterase
LPQGYYIATDEQDISSRDPANATTLLATGDSTSGLWVWDSSNTSSDQTGIVSVNGYATGRWKRLIGTTASPSLNGSRVTLTDSSKRYSESLITAADLNISYGLRSVGGTGNGSTDNTPYLSTFDALTDFLREYRATNYVAVNGVNPTPDGVVHNATSGRVYNPRAHDYQRVFGVETLEFWFRQSKNQAYPQNSSAQTTVKKIVISGDSTTYGVGATTNWYAPEFALQRQAQLRGFGYVSVLNRGQSGKATFDWLTNYASGDISTNPHLLILRWGANDPYFSRTPAQFISYLRAGLAQIRASKNVQNLSILICTPGPMNDPYYRRTEAYFDQIRSGIAQAARDYQCAFLDTFSNFQNAHDGVGYWMDSDSSSGTARGIHPTDILYTDIAAAISDVIFPLGYEPGRVNGFMNYSSADSQWNTSSGTGLTTYEAGISQQRMISSGTNGAPYDGVVWTFKSPETATLQLNTGLPGTTGSSGLSARIGFGSTASQWYGGKNDGASILANSWLNFSGSYAGCTYSLTLEGFVRLDGLIKPGTTTDGTIIMTLPSGFRPPLPTIVTATAENAGTIMLAIASSGNVQIYGWGSRAGGSTYLCLDGASFPTF